MICLKPKDKLKAKRPRTVPRIMPILLPYVLTSLTEYSREYNKQQLPEKNCAGMRWKRPARYYRASTVITELYIMESSLSYRNPANCKDGA